AGQSPADLVLNRHCQECQFRARCRSKAHEIDDLSLLSGMTEKERSRHRSKGIFTVTQLSYTFRPRRTPKRVKAQSKPHNFALQALAIREAAYCVVPGRPKCGIQPLLSPAMGLQGRTLWRGRDRSPSFSRRFPTRRAARPSCSNVAGRMDSFVPLAATPARPR